MKLFKKKAERKPLTIDCEIDCRHVDVVDGIRGISVLLVLWFHFWQQTWLMPSYPTPWLSFLGIKELTPVHIRWVGYLFVDMMVLLSAFCLFLPVARSIFLGEGMDDACTFYKKRFARIYPSYLVAVLVSFFVLLSERAYPTPAEAARDLISHLTFTNLFRIDTYVFSKINGVLWTVALEAQFYLIFPLLAKLCKRFGVIVYIVLTGFGLWFINAVALKTEPVSMMVNQFPTFLPVFMNGFLCACFFTWYTARCKCKLLLGFVFTALAVLSAIWIQKLIVSCYMYTENKQYWQLKERYRLSLAFSAFLVSASLSLKPLRWLFSNRLARFLGEISFNMYIWHQRIMVRLVRSLGFTYGGDVSAAGTKMQWLLTLEGLALSFAVAMCMTYLVEKPCRNRILGLGKKSAGNNDRGALPENRISETSASETDTKNAVPETLTDTNHI